jgi:WhiB family redox-sensing transcriptional regulator
VRREVAAKTICGRCPVIAECAAHALAVREPYGVWGGMSEDDREAILSGAQAPAAIPSLAS